MRKLQKNSKKNGIVTVGNLIGKIKRNPGETTDRGRKKKERGKREEGRGENLRKWEKWNLFKRMGRVDQ